MRETVHWPLLHSPTFSASLCQIPAPEIESLCSASTNPQCPTMAALRGFRPPWVSFVKASLFLLCLMWFRGKICPGVGTTSEPSPVLYLTGDASPIKLEVLALMLMFTLIVWLLCVYLGSGKTVKDSFLCLAYKTNIEFQDLIHSRSKE